MGKRKPQTGRLRVGTSGYQYDHWRGVLYPEGLPKKQWFAHYADHFDTVEINNTFYNLPSAETFNKWRQQTPAGFVYALKYSRFGSHIKRLKDPGNHVPTFLERADRLGTALGPILVQLPPNWRANADRLREFTEALDTSHRWVIEVRDTSWLTDEIYGILREAHVGLCIHDMIEDHPRVVTTGWTYLRFHGESYAGSYSRKALNAWAKWIKEQLDGGVDVYAYFNNDAEGHAVANAQDLHRAVVGGEKRSGKR